MLTLVREYFDFRYEFGVLLKGIHRAVADGVAQCFKIGAGGSWRVYIKVRFYPVVEECWFTVRGFDDSRMEVLGIKSDLEK